MALVTPNTQIAAINASNRPPLPSGGLLGGRANTRSTSGPGAAFGSEGSDGSDGPTESDEDEEGEPAAPDPGPDGPDDAEAGGTTGSPDETGSVPLGGEGDGDGSGSARTTVITVGSTSKVVRQDGDIVME